MNRSRTKMKKFIVQYQLHRRGPSQYIEVSSSDPSTAVEQAALYLPTHTIIEAVYALCLTVVAE